MPSSFQAASPRTLALGSADRLVQRYRFRSRLALELRLQGGRKALEVLDRPGSVPAAVPAGDETAMRRLVKRFACDDPLVGDHGGVQLAALELELCQARAGVGIQPSQPILLLIPPEAGAFPVQEVVAVESHGRLEQGDRVVAGRSSRECPAGQRFEAFYIIADDQVAGEAIARVLHDHPL